MTTQSFTNKEMELLVAIFKSSGSGMIKPSWTRIQEMGLMPDGMTYNAAAQVYYVVRLTKRGLEINGDRWFKMKKKLMPVVDEQVESSAASPVKRVRPDEGLERRKRGRPLGSGKKKNNEDSPKRQIDSSLVKTEGRVESNDPNCAEPSGLFLDDDDDESVEEDGNSDEK